MKILILHYRPDIFVGSCIGCSALTYWTVKPLNCAWRLSDHGFLLAWIIYPVSTSIGQIILVDSSLPILWIHLNGIWLFFSKNVRCLEVCRFLLYKTLFERSSMWNSVLKMNFSEGNFINRLCGLMLSLSMCHLQSECCWQLTILLPLITTSFILAHNL